MDQWYDFGVYHEGSSGGGAAKILKPAPEEDVALKKTCVEGDADSVQRRRFQTVWTYMNFRMGHDAEKLSFYWGCQQNDCLNESPNSRT